MKWSRFETGLGHTVYLVEKTRRLKQCLRGNVRRKMRSGLAFTPPYSKQSSDSRQWSPTTPGLQLSFYKADLDTILACPSSLQSILSQLFADLLPRLLSVAIANLEAFSSFLSVAESRRPFITLHSPSASFAATCIGQFRYRRAWKQFIRMKDEQVNKSLSSASIYKIWQALMRWSIQSMSNRHE